MPLTSKTAVSKFPELIPGSDIVRGMGLLALPQAMLSFSQKDSSPGAELLLLQVFSSPIVVNVLSIALLYGDCMLVGSGEVPQDELAPLLECEEADGELYDVL